MIAPAIYYLSLSITCLALCIYNLNISESSKGLQCYKIETMDATNYQNYINSLQNNTQNLTSAENYFNLNTGTNTGVSSNPSTSFLSANNSGVFYQVPVEETNKYKNLQKTIGALYIIISILSLFISLSVNYMSNLIPEDFINMGKIKRFFGSLSKLLPIVNIILHWVILGLIIVIWGFVGAKACEKSLSTDPSVISQPNKYYSDTWILNTVTSAFWILIHYLGSCLREIFYKEPFMYSQASIKKSCLRTFFTKVGP